MSEILKAMLVLRVLIKQGKWEKANNACDKLCDLLGEPRVERGRVIDLFELPRVH